MQTYIAVLTDGTEVEEARVRAANGDVARSEALVKAADKAMETGKRWRVIRCDPA